jgi:hypothetical protein
MPRKAKVAQLNLPIDKIENIESDESDDEIELKPVTQKTINELEPPVPVPVEKVKEKKKRNITEEHKEMLRERLKTAHARKKELADARRAVKEQEEENHLAKKQLAILEQARLIKQRQKKEIESIAKTTPQGDKPKKASKVKYVIEDDDTSEEEVVVLKKPKKAKTQTHQPVQQPVQQQTQFQIKFY